jgi:predicted  nucleic acid-binding Zn-ribbon protein
MCCCFLERAMARMEEKIMASLQDVVEAVDQDKQGVEAAAARLTADLQALSQQITDLQAQIASGAGVTSADLDALKAGVDAVTGEAAAIDPTAPPAPPA